MKFTTTVLLAVAVMVTTATAQTTAKTPKPAKPETVPPALIDQPKERYLAAVDAVERAFKDFSYDAAKTCHELHLTNVEGNDRPSHSTAYSCYTNDKPMADALTEVKKAAFDYGAPSIPEKLEKLKAMLDDDVKFFSVDLTEYER